VRLSERFKTVEFRVTDVHDGGRSGNGCRTHAHWCGLVTASARDEPFPTARPELVRAAHWPRYGLDTELIDIGALAAVPAPELIEVLAFLRPSLEEFGEWDEVSSIVRNNAARYRCNSGVKRYKRAGRWEDVVDLVVRRRQEQREG